MSEGESSHVTERARLVRSLAERSHVTDARILAAFRAVPRHHFVPPELASAPKPPAITLMKLRFIARHMM